MASSNWPGLIDELREGFLAKNLSQMKFPAPDPSPVVQEFADLWAEKQGVSVFVESLVFQYRHEGQRIFEIENQGLRSTVRLSRESLDDLSFWMGCLKNRGEEEWVMADDPIDDAHVGNFYTVNLVEGTCKASR